MNVLILSSASKNIDPYYVGIARDISKYLAKNDFDLIFGGASCSMMGACYDEFVRHDRNIYAFTTEKYMQDLENLKFAKPFIRETTFDLKKSMFENSDLIVALPGGLGTLSEITSYIEENRSNDKVVPIEIYDENNYYQKFFEMLDDMKTKGFIEETIINNISVSHNKSEFIEHISKFLIDEKVRVK